jgi:hypothetical protein
MPAPKDTRDAWKDLNKLIESQPKEDYFRYMAAIRTFVHDLRHCIAITYGVETIMRKTMDETPTNQELLDSLHTSNQRANELIAAFIKSFDREDTTPSLLPPEFDPRSDK